MLRRLLLLVCLSSSAAFAASPKRVSLELVNADITSVLRLFAEVGRFNLVTSEEVSGKVTVSLRNVPWDQAFQVVLASKGLGLDRHDTIYRVAPLSRLTDEAEARARRSQAEFNARPLVTRLIPVNYASAADMAQQVKAVLSPRGSVSIDARTNTLIVRDVEGD